MHDIIEALNWRYATKIYDPKKKLSTEKFEILLEALRLSPSSYGLQPWKFVVVRDPAVRARLRVAGYDQSSFTDASHLVILAVRRDLDGAYVEEYIRSMAVARGLAPEALKGPRNQIRDILRGRSPESILEWSTRQVYVALGVLLTAAGHEQIDATPLEGFDAKKFDEILGFKELDLESRLAVALGYRSPEDKHAAEAKVRFPKEKVVIEING
ncbi:MAG: NAD(P)H-dependent oxidoreductase [Patescibacteria group bacterium]|jgi:nitroreductase